MPLPAATNTLSSKFAPQLTRGQLFSIGMGLFTGMIYWRYNVAIRSRLYTSELKLKNITTTGLQECRELLKGAQAAWDADIKERNEQLRALQLQNVEQTRSVARLDGAMKSCLIS